MASPPIPPKPYDAEVEYLTTDMHSPYGDNSGQGAYIDTGLTWSDLGPRDFIVETWNDFRFNWGIMTPGETSTAWIGRSGDNMMFGNFSNRVANGGPSTGRHHNSFDVIDGLYVDGTLVAPAGTSWSAPPLNHSVSLFVTRDKNKAPYAYWYIGSVGAVQFRRRSTGEILRDFIAVRKGTVGYLYDRANPTGGPLGNGLYPNAGIGSFVIGPDVVKPYDAEVEYLESTGTQYIDTGFVPTGATTLLVDQAFTSVYKRNGFGCNMRDNGGMTICQREGSTMLFCIGARMYNATIVDSDTLRHTYRIEATTSRLYIDGAKQTKSDLEWSGVSPHPIFLCGYMDTVFSTAVFAASAKLYSCSIYDGSILVHDYIPVRVGTIGYIFDRANPTGGPLGNGLYPNVGTGSFVIGPDVWPPLRR